MSAGSGFLAQLYEGELEQCGVGARPAEERHTCLAVRVFKAASAPRPGM